MLRSLTTGALAAAERGIVPDPLLRRGMRAAIAGRLRTEVRRPDTERERWLEEWTAGPIALVPEAANRQHYEVPAGFFELILGPRLKYSACLWPDRVDTLAAAEEAMLELTCERAGVADGMRILDLGCGWGSLALWIAERYPGTDVVAVSNSASQGDLISRRAAGSGLGNVTHRIADVNHFDPGERFDRVVSVEMVEHVRNHTALLERMSGWLEPDGAAFIHHFSHRRYRYPFEDRGPQDWMTRTFFAGGIMPDHRLLETVDAPLRPVESWWVEGTHYRRTLDAWLANLDAARPEVTASLASHTDDVDRAVQRWRMFLMACSELFGYADGAEWGVSHHLLRPR